MKIANKKGQRSFYRILLAIGGTTILIAAILAIKTAKNWSEGIYDSNLLSKLNSVKS